MNAILKKLQIKPVNRGVCTGPDGWLESDAEPIVSLNPTTGEPIASVLPATAVSYNSAVDTAQSAFHSWRSTPAPQRGQLVRDLGNALRDN
jgi:aldehyde dehydrogenase (NAD+)